VRIPDEVIDTESNLWPVVLKKNLFRLGLDHDRLKHHDGTIANLVNRRNGIGHGTERAGVTEGAFTNLQRSVYEVMDEVIAMIIEALSNRTYLNTANISAASSLAEPAGGPGPLSAN
jgi:hypothetical protein